MLEVQSMCDVCMCVGTCLSRHECGGQGTYRKLTLSFRHAAPGNWIQALRLGGKCLNCWSTSRTRMWVFLVKRCSIGQKHSNLGLSAHLRGHLGHFQPDEAVGSLCVWPFAHACAFFPLRTNVTQITKEPSQSWVPVFKLILSSKAVQGGAPVWDSVFLRLFQTLSLWHPLPWTLTNSLSLLTFQYYVFFFSF